VLLTAFLNKLQPANKQASKQTQTNKKQRKKQTKNPLLQF
jgi:hypothetical protein